jgi:putative addiction module antidote
MTKALKVRRIGNSYGIILSKEVLDALGLREGDALFVVRTQEGIRLTPYDPDFAAVVESNRDYMRRHRYAFRELAKRCSNRDG